jgi:ketosteroid isomerase-like protein
MTKSDVKAVAIAASSFMLLGIAPVYAGVDAVRAEAYFNAISGGNADTITSFYADDAEFHWVGGPLAGVYKGKDKIRGVWDRFTKAAGDISHQVMQLSESANGKTSTVTASVMFRGEGEVPVKFIMVYKDGKIASEVWQVDRAALTYAKADGRPGSESKPESGAKPRTVEPKFEAPKSEASIGNPVPPPVAKPALTISLAQPPLPTARPAVLVEPERKPARVSNRPLANMREEAGGPGAADERAGGPAGRDVVEGETPTSVPGGKARIAPEKSAKAEPKPAESRVKAGEEKTSAYGGSVEEKKSVRKKRSYGSAYGYGQRGYGGHNWASGSYGGNNCAN